MATGDFDCIVIGAGPAGLQLGYFLQRSQRSYLILEREAQVASFLRRFPRHRRLISFNKVWSVYTDPEIRLRWDWNSLLTDGYEHEFRRYSEDLYPQADDLVNYLEDYATKYQLNVALDSDVTRVSCDTDGSFRVLVEDRTELRSQYLVVATGWGKPYVPPIPGVELACGYESVPIDAQQYRGQRILILGKGNSAFELADTLIDVASLVHVASPRPVRLAWNTKHPGDVRGHTVRLLDMYQLKLLNGALDCTITDISRCGTGIAVTMDYTHASGERETMLYDQVIRCTGFQFDDSIFDDTSRPALSPNGRMPSMTSAWESTNVPNLFFAGTLMQARDFKRSSSAFIDGFRYNIRTLHRLMEARHGNTRLQGTGVEPTAAALSTHVLNRVSRTSALWAQFTFLCDVLIVDQDGTDAIYHEELPIDYVHDGDLGREGHYYTISFEWGSWTGDVFAIERHPGSETAEQSAFLHPVIRRFEGDRQLRVHHVLEDLFGTYGSGGDSDVVMARQGGTIEQYHARQHRLPLQRFFESELDGLGAPPT